MTRAEKKAESAAPAEEIRLGLHSGVDEIIESVLDAADADILEDLGEERGARHESPELLCELLLDLLGRYAERQRQAAAQRAPARRTAS